jgi:hypothetical protein
MDDPSALDDPATRSLARALYWVHEPRASREGAGAGTREIRERMMGFAWRMRVDEGVLIPLGEPHLGAATPLKRRVKYLLFRLLRFMTARYERLLAEQTDLSVSLAERVIELEVQLQEMRDRLDRTDPNPRRHG